MVTIVRYHVHRSASCRVPECSQQEEVRIKEPLNLVISLKHLALVVRVHDPVVRAEVERGRMRYLLPVSHLHLGAVARAESKVETKLKEIC